MRNSSFLLPLRYCRRSKLVFTSFCFQTVPKPEQQTAAAWIMNPNSQKCSQKLIPYHWLRKSPFDVHLNSFIVWITDNETSRIIQSYHVTEHAILYKLTVFWPPGETRLLIAFSYRLELLTQAANFEDTNSLSPSFLWNDEGKQAIKTKAECFKAWRLFSLSSLFLSNMHYWPSVRSIWLDIWPNSLFFFHFVRRS